jgi:site-specific DNA-methyltransferase (adenine-specific)
MSNTLYYGDNLDVLRRHVADESVDLIYIDPPFNSNRNYFVLFKDRTGKSSAAQEAAFEDTWTWTEDSEAAYRELFTSCSNQNLVTTIEALRKFLHETPMMAYVVAMAIRLVEMHRVLKPTGSFYLHCDPTASHYLKIVLDVIFGPTSFRNEITWKRTSAHSDARHKWADVADVILYYTKSKSAQFEPQYVAHDKAYLENFYTHNDNDGRGLYALDNMASPNPRANLMYEWLGYPFPTKGWRYSTDTMQKLHEEGRISYPRLKDGSPDLTKRPRLKRYLAEQEGSIVTNVWSDIHPVQSRGEALGYPTQKPLALLERIINASSNPGDVVLDCYCGCGTTVTAAHKLGRKWIGIDITAVSVAVIKSRLENSFEDLKGNVKIEGFPTDFEGAKQLFEMDPHRFQIWSCTLIDAYPLTKKGADGGIDGWLNFLDLDGTPCKAVVQVKGGKVQVGLIRDFCHVVQREKATLGFFICFGEVTEPMRTEAIKEGYWADAGNRDYPKVQILTVAELLAGTQKARYPAQFSKSMLGFKAEVQDVGGQATLGV